MPFSVRRLESTPKRSFPWKRITLGLKLLQPVARMYGSWKAAKNREHARHRNISLLKRILLILIAVLFAFFLIAGVVRALVGLRIVGVGTITSIAGSNLPIDEHGFSNILILGQGDLDHDGKDLTDTIIVASIDPKDTKSVALLSIPRDTFFLHTEKMGKGKLNTFYRDYKGYLRYREGMSRDEASIEALREIGLEVGRKLGMHIHHVVKIDFIAFTKIVDALGGIDIDVPEEIIDTQYPDDQYGYEPFTISAGPQHLDGKTALKYVRSRNTTSDFSRSARQQQVLSAIAEQAKKEGHLFDPGFIRSMLDTLSEHVETTLNLREMIGVAGVADALDRSRLVTMQLNDRNGLYGEPMEPGGFLYAPPRNLFEGAAVLLPVSIPEFPVTWKQPRTLMRLLSEARGVYLVNPTIHVLNNGARSGLARKLALEMKKYGFQIGAISNASLPETQEESIIFTQNREMEPLAQFFAGLLDLSEATMLPDLPPEETSELTIILGKDYSFTPIQDLLSPINP